MTVRVKLVVQFRISSSLLKLMSLTLSSKAAHEACNILNNEHRRTIAVRSKRKRLRHSTARSDHTRGRRNFAEIIHFPLCFKSDVGNMSAY